MEMLPEHVTISGISIQSKGPDAWEVKYSTEEGVPIYQIWPSYPNPTHQIGDVLERGQQTCWDSRRHYWMNIGRPENTRPGIGGLAV